MPSVIRLRQRLTIQMRKYSPPRPVNRKATASVFAVVIAGAANSIAPPCLDRMSGESPFRQSAAPLALPFGLDDFERGPAGEAVQRCLHLRPRHRLGQRVL